MNLKENKGLIVLFVIIIILLFITLGLYIYVEGFNNQDNEESKDTQVEETTNIFKTVDDSADVILSKVYNKDIDMYAEGYPTEVLVENIFGNENETLASSFTQEYKMALALYSFDIKSLEKIKCDEIWNDQIDGIVCGGAGENSAYKLSVQELNNRVVELFNEDLDYSKIDTSKLVIGTCGGKEGIALLFRYIQSESVYVSALRAGSCMSDKGFEVTNVTKVQDKDLLTLDVYYTVSDYNYDNGKYVNPVKKHDKLYFKVKDDGSYYFYSSIMVENDIK